MRILVIPTTDWLRHPVPSRHNYIFERLAKKHEVFVWHFNLFPYNAPLRKNDSIKIIEAPSINFKDLFSYYLFNAPFHYFSMIKIVNKLQIDVVYGAHLLHVALAFLSKPDLVRIFDLSDLFSEIASVYYPHAHPYLRWSFEKAAQHIVKMNSSLADFSVAPTRFLMDTLKKMGAHKAYFIPNGVDTSLFSPGKIDETNNIQEQIGEHSVCYVGSISSWLDLETVLRGLELVKKEIPGIRLVIIGRPLRSSNYARIRHMVTKLGLRKNVIDLGYQPYESLPLHLNRSSCCLVPFRTDLGFSKYALPNKLFEYSACGKTILSTPLPEIMSLGAKHILYYSSPEEFSKLLVHVLQDDALMAKNRDFAIEFAKDYDWDMIASRLEALMLEALASRD